MRGPSARELLRLDWDYPDHLGQESPELAGRSAARPMRAALGAAEALAAVAGDDPRPLLVLRECAVCNGTDDALLQRGATHNDKTLLLSRWFHCVKLTQDVLEDDHPFRALFDGKDPEHLFLTTRDGSLRVPLKSEGSRTELWGAMVRVLRASYRDDPERSLKKLLGLLDDLDAADGEVAKLRTEVDRLLESEGPDSYKVARAQRQVLAAQKELEVLHGEVAELSRLELEPPPTAK